MWWLSLLNCVCAMEYQYSGQAPVPLTIFRSNSKFDQIFLYIYKRTRLSDQFRRAATPSGLAMESLLCRTKSYEFTTASDGRILWTCNIDCELLKKINVMLSSFVPRVIKLDYCLRQWLLGERAPDTCAQDRTGHNCTTSLVSGPTCYS